MGRKPSVLLLMWLLLLLLLLLLVVVIVVVVVQGHAVAQLVEALRKVVGSNPDGVIRIFH
jgi:cell division protein FtsL